MTWLKQLRRGIGPVLYLLLMMAISLQLVRAGLALLDGDWATGLVLYVVVLPDWWIGAGLLSLLVGPFRDHVPTLRRWALLQPVAAKPGPGPRT